MTKKISLGTITLGDRIGGGGFGEVYKAKMEPFEQTFAVKMLKPSPFHTNETRLLERFIKEAEMLMTLRHPNITPVYGVGEDDGTPYILMEYFRGLNLHEARERVGEPNALTVLRFIERTSLALEHAHNKKIVHRDIKPSNLLTRRNDARVVDFGIAQLIDPEGDRFTKTGGTPVGDAYSAPELVDNPRLIDPRCDIYSLAACWYWLLTGSTPRGRNWESKLRSVDGINPQYEGVVLKALDQIEKRHQTMAELAANVRALQDGRSDHLATSEGLEDDAALVLGVVFEKYALEEDAVSAYQIEQQLGRATSRFALGLNLRMLCSRDLLNTLILENNFNEPWTGYIVTESGLRWIERHRARVESLLDTLYHKNDEPGDTGEQDDNNIPF